MVRFHRVFIVLGLVFGAAALFSQEWYPVASGTGLQPEEAAKAMSLPPGFKATLFAGDPDVHQPIAFTIDEKGRLWVIENYSYPDWSPYGRDRIVVYEDTDGDGRFNTSKVFFDQLNFASGIAVGHGGVWVGSPPYLLFIPDRNRDDLPDGPPQPVLDGWGHHDTHETLNSFVWGPDGWLYGNHGVFTFSNVGKPGARDKDRTPLNACIWRYHPYKKTFEVFAEGMSNQWGLDFNDVGDSFVTACVIPHLWHVIQGGRYQRQAGNHVNPYTYADIKTIADHAHYDATVRFHEARMGQGGTDAAGGGHAHAGALVYLGDSFPAEYRGSLLMNNILGSRINRDILERRGSGYVGHHAPDFMKANDGWFRGLRLELGPDGSVFDSDWYDQRACHQQKPQDRTNGRIYKISYGDRKVVGVDLSKETSEQLVKYQLHANEWFVRRSRVILQERGPDPAVHKALHALLTEEHDVTRKLRALWALHATRGLTPALAKELLASPEEYLRAWTIQLTCEDKSPSAEFLARFAEMARTDPSPVVRRFLASAAQRISLTARWPIVEALLRRVEDTGDHNLPLLYWYAAEPLVAVDRDRAVQIGAQTPFAALKPYFTRRAAALTEGTGGGTDTEGLATLTQGLRDSDDAAYQKEILAAVLAKTEGQSDLTPPAGWSEVYSKLTASPDTEVATMADRLTARFGNRALTSAKRAVLEDPFAPLAARQDALRIIGEQTNFQNTPLFQKLLPEPGLRLGSLAALARYDVPTTPGAIFANFAGFTAEEKRAAIGVLVTRLPYAQALMGAIKSKVISPADVDASFVRQLALLNDPGLDQDVAATWGVAKERPEEVLAEIARWKKVLTPQKLAAASATRGHEVFTRTCASCHTLFGEGRHVGPDLTGSNRGDLDYVLQNVIDPNAIIGRDYQLAVIETNDGRSLAGIAKETPETVTVVNMAESVVLARSAIKKMEHLEVSLMPPGLFQGVSEDDVADLIAYLATGQR
ncbi:MAG TPA: c-type cytochrome [Opitutaceae bacterium]|nr:c-type cytochrome [Opitutaceae bacterium]